MLKFLLIKDTFRYIGTFSYNGINEYHILFDFSKLSKSKIQTSDAHLCASQSIFGTIGFVPKFEIETGFAFMSEDKIVCSIEEPMLYA